jgi:hypothetical protein
VTLTLAGYYTGVLPRDWKTCMSFTSVRRRVLKYRLLEHFTTIEILAYRAALLITFLIYAYKHIKTEWFSP